MYSDNPYNSITLLNVDSDDTGMSVTCRPVEHSGSGVELGTLDYENPGSNPGCGVKTLGKFFSLYIAPVHSAV